jgi:hypothetical protein
MMKRALTAALFSGLFVFAVPQLAFADHAADHSGDCGAKTEQTADSNKQAPEEHHEGDSEAHDDDTILF